MKLKMLFLFILSNLSYAAGWLDDAYGLWGVGMAVRDRNYINSAIVYSPGVYIFGGYGPLFIEANRAGISFYRDGTYFASAVLNIRSHQFRKDDKGLSDRKTAFEAGIHLGRRLPAGMVTRLAFLHDISAAHKSYELDWQLFRHNHIGPIRLLTAIGIQYQSEKLVDYYYGTKEYSPTAALGGEVEVIVTYPFGHWAVFAGSRIYAFDSEVSDSPIADDYLIKQYFAGFGYHF